MLFLLSLSLRGYPCFSNTCLVDACKALWHNCFVWFYIFWCLRRSHTFTCFLVSSTYYHETSREHSPLYVDQCIWGQGHGKGSMSFCDLLITFIVANSPPPLPPTRGSHPPQSAITPTVPSPPTGPPRKFFTLHDQQSDKWCLTSLYTVQYVLIKCLKVLKRAIKRVYFFIPV